MSSEEERIKELLKALDDKKAAESAAWALGEIGEASLQALEDTYKESENTDKRILIIKALRKIGRKSVPFLIQMLREEKDYWVRLAIVRAFGRMGKQAEEACLVLFRELKDKDLYYKQKVRWALKEMSRDSEMIALMISEYKHPLGLKIAKAIDTFPEKFSLAVALEKIKNKEAKQLNEYYQTLNRYYDENLIPILVELLNDKDPEMQLRAIIAFRVLNKKAKSAIPHLYKAWVNNRFELLLTILIIEGLQGKAMEELERMRDNDLLDIDQEWKFETQVTRQRKKS
ncbi:MAG: HEAT repeat domain-containing protein [Asgard group archaeon]|nr:HEAT repeat domain-containing protein [Asgard group archaeon]